MDDQKDKKQNQENINSEAKPETTDFMKETIKQRPLNRKKLLRRTIITASMAVIFRSDCVCDLFVAGTGNQ